MVNWSPKLQTAVSDLEVEYSEEPGALYHIKYRVAGGTRDDFLTIATTRPETLFGDTAIAVNPEDERYSKYIGKMAIVPMTYGRHVPIISDKYVDKDFGTGVLKISPGHDHNDYLLARKLGLPILNVMNKDGTLNEVAGLYCGLDRFEARKKLWSELEETGLAVKKEAYTMRVPRSQRGGEIIEPLVSKQWFVTMDSLAERALHAVEKGELTIVPERFEKIYNHWLSNIKDWCISRQLWWGHRIPVWYIVGKKCEDEYIVARNNEEALEKAREKYGKDVEIYQDPDVLDTWFSSALWPFSTLGWPDGSAEDFKNFYPTSVLETGHDILFFWVARMVMMGIEFTGTVPFSHVYLHGLIRDSQGRKMSKSLGNVIDPLDTIKDYGTDALRFTLSLGTAGQDLNLSTERLTSTKAFTNKLWNGGKFVLQNLPPQSDLSAWTAIQDYKFDEEESLLKLPLPECWVVTKLHMLIDAVTMSYDKFFFGDVAREIYDFFWADFADWYIEASKARLYQGDGSVASVAQAVLLYVFGSILKLLHPFMPFVTEELWQSLPNRKEALIVSAWPSTSLPRQTESVKKFENLQALTRAIRNARAEYSVEPAKRISASIVANAEVIQYISKEKDVLVLLSRLDLENVSFSQSPPGDASQSVHLVASEGLEAYLPLADMVDISAEMQRLSKRLAKMQTEYDGLMARLSSPSFVEKAPEDIVRGVREKAAEAEEKVTLTRNRLAFLQSTTLMPNQAQ
ncbi:valine--tRNA ligase, chloroplastic/mitochondrial 2-like isoform X2 [Salvia splendens]|nr:valine--tRNA ligase, chloroplastic/mitochondrial 2-like isoform X2 [Salvia splendens]